MTELVRGLEESGGHIHDKSCIDDDVDLICSIPGAEGHTHTNVCYETTQVLIRGLGEGPAAAGHTHYLSCYEEILVREIPGHVHSIERVMDETADVEVYKKTVRPSCG